ncbi:hypothetical protein NA57DRAFT_53008 [Rhizodiscina lignyota]|uniref:Uncharacterized protein n=1 Tax=Rhizodiscina lignyota TaxID=1504668 RepID=A0A9P4IPU5_9PEZI|nr:hypothetical protein NA57DRAFT_53008 [Rhizodiscina lignyota]
MAWLKPIFKVRRARGSTSGIRLDVISRFPLLTCREINGTTYKPDPSLTPLNLFEQHKPSIRIQPGTSFTFSSLSHSFQLERKEDTTTAMESITNVASNAANTASKLIWGEGKTESGQEPVSGQQGPGSKTEPFDQGNKEGEVPTSSEGQTATSTAAVGDSGSANPGTGNDVTESQEPVNTSSEGQTATSTAAVGEPGSGDPSTGADVTESQKPVQKQQGADKPTDEPTGAQEDAVKEKKDDAEKAMEHRDPNDHSGEPMQMHDGSEKKEEEESGDAAGQPDEEKSKEEGTGEQYVKSSGMAAEGGDFDATKPGAGSEANRLLEEHGVHKDAGNQGPPQQAESSGGVDDSKAKPKMLEKVKEKLHIGKH